MSNVEDKPAVVTCDSAPGTGIEVIAPREVPLGGLRAMTVRRTLPTRQRSLIGAWCFVDHYGPTDTATNGMNVSAHPHTGLQTVSWLFSGEIEHRDSAGHRAMVRPGEVNLMTAGRGISHSEVSTGAAPVTHGAQLWVALPDGARQTDPGFEHYVPDPVDGQGWAARVFLGSLLGSTSPVVTHTPLLGAEVVLAPGHRLEPAVDGSFEHGVLVDTGEVAVDGMTGSRGDLLYAAPGRSVLPIAAGDDGARILVLGGPPFGEPIVMWWNFVGRDHDEIVGFREEWQAQITAADGAVHSDAQEISDGRFGIVLDDHQPPIPAPALPNARLRERR